MFEVATISNGVRRVLNAEVSGKCQFSVLVKLYGDDIYPTRFYPCAAGGRLGVVSRQLPCHASILFQVRPPELCQVEKEGAFNEVSADHSLEWLNSIGKRGGGIVGITKTSSALSRWALSYNLRSEIAEKTHEMFGLVQEDTYSYNESAPARIVRDNKDEESLISVFEQHHVFSPTSHPECLFSIAMKDLATVEIQESLLGAKDMGQKQVKDFVQQRLTEPLQQQPNNLTNTRFLQS
ncbi:Hypothetical predicted protein [Paramuricea clavata]|uniref:Uncharacterized protein n=1 Tax=Paramuricea clavata TaxID=317549 RepID=A0A7D9HS94_PARCT|nr:Hypothetical predicted protein [Paramuricea clavata]